MQKKQLWLLAGGNGAGKSTFYREFLLPRGLPFVNADNIARRIAPESPEAASYDAARIAESLRQNLLLSEASFCFETVFSHPSKVDFLGHAKALGYEIILVFIHLSHPQLNKARVAQRVSEGGHSVPEEKIESRIPRTLEHIKIALPLCDEVHLLDNSRHDSPFYRIATLIERQAKIKVDELPAWASELLQDYR